MEFFRGDSRRLKTMRSARTRERQERGEVRLDLGAFRDPSGSWLARVMFEDLLLAEGRFEVGDPD